MGSGEEKENKQNKTPISDLLKIQVEDNDKPFFKVEVEMNNDVVAEAQEVINEYTRKPWNKHLFIRGREQPDLCFKCIREKEGCYLITDELVYNSLESKLDHLEKEHGFCFKIVDERREVRESYEESILDKDYSEKELHRYEKKSSDCIDRRLK